MTAVDWARAWIERGFVPIPIPYRSKKPDIKGWPDLRIDMSNAEQYFNGKPSNIGVLLGVYGACDVDLDCTEAIAAASNFLPPTGLIHGGKQSLQSLVLPLRPADPIGQV